MPGFGSRIGVSLRLPAQRGKRVAVIVAVLVLATGVGTGVGFSAPVLARHLAAAGAVPAIAPPPAPVIPQPALRPAAVDGPAPTSSGVEAVLDPLLAKGGLGTLSGQVMDPATGMVLWQRASATPLVPGSTAKLLTASAALLALDHQARLHTTVLAGAEPDTVVLLGGGDPTLSAADAATVTVYPGAARLDDLVAQVRAVAPGPVRRVLVDVNRYTGDAFAPGWVPADVAGGYIAPIQPVMLDGARADPTEEVSPRAAKPATAAAAELARRLGADPDIVAVGSAPPGAAVLGTVSSPPIQDLVATVLSRSDNVLAEALAREVARATGAQPSFSGAAQAVLTVLREHGFDVSRATLMDGSGLSVQDAVPATLLTDLLSAAAGPDESQQRTAALRPMLGGLPVAGSSGTLAERYDGPAAGGRGWVRAKTGTLTGVNSLAGTVLDAEGRVLAFALLSNGPDPVSVRPRLDALAAELRSCGCR
ncbi:MAG TPA: D-alanyl-D-alanine carboxypeptidase/D-alanyl-D-alanine-endopeptidase [Pseudonocardiaceae bacterium]|nr:D-alanyl-D-alanine carboxypeptidase/D-alanyl-D-alanine-endopeptidase [Pseudonocardiaceae bacterium]